MRAFLATALFLAFVGVAAAQQSESGAPSECRYDAAGRIDYEACLRVAPAGSPWWSLSQINLGTQAFLQSNYGSALRHYDAAQPTDGSTFYSDASYHAFYSATLHAVGRSNDAIVQARRALGIIRNAADIPAEVRRRFSQSPVELDFLYAAILPVLHAANDPEFSSAREAYLAIPAQDWVAWVNRAGTLSEIGDIENGLRANQEALRLEPNHPAVLNNQCYMLALANRAGEAMPFCERARAAAPDIAAIRHSVSAALAALGRCEEAERELAEARRLDPASEAYRQNVSCAP